MLRSPLQAIDSNQSTHRSQQSRNQDIKIPIPITKQKLSTVPDITQKENQTMFMSPRNMKLKTQTFNQNNCRSPISTQKELKTVQSPYNYSLHSAQSPLRTASTSLIKQDSDILKEQNYSLQQIIVNLSSEVQRGQSSQWLKELQQKIKLLTDMNNKLKKENQEIITRGNVVELRKQNEQQLETKKQLEKQLSEIRESIARYDCSKFHLEKNNATDYITQLILDLEERVHVLIVENGNLNKEFNQRIKFAERFATLELEIKQAQVLYQKSKLEEKLYRTKFNQLRKK